MKATGTQHPRGWVNVLDEHGGFRTLADIRGEVIARALQGAHADLDQICFSLRIDRDILDGVHSSEGVDL